MVEQRKLLEFTKSNRLHYLAQFCKVTCRNSFPVPVGKDKLRSAKITYLS